MNDQFIYGEPVYGQEIPYDTGIDNNNNNDSNQVQGVDYGFDLSNFQQTTSNVSTLPTITYQQFEQQQFQDPNQIYNNQIFIQQGQGKIAQEYHINQNANIQEFENYFQNQEQKLPQTNIIYQQIPQVLPNPNISQQKRNIASQVIPLKTNTQPIFPSRNPNIKQQYQQPQNISLNNQPNIVQPQITNNMKKENFVFQNQIQNLDEDIPQIESDFQPNIPLANSIISQSKIPIELKPAQGLPLNPQNQQIPIQSRIITQQSQNYQKAYVIPRRNPNLKITQYENIDNESHFVIAADPGLRTTPYKSNLNQNQSNQKPNISQKISEEKEEEKKSVLSKKTLEANFEPTQNDKEFANQLFNKDDEKKNIIFNTDIQGRNIAMSNMNDINNIAKSQAEKNIEFSSVQNLEKNIMESKFSNEELDKENPIEEKKPDESNMDIANDLNSNNQKEINQNQPEISQSIEIDDNLDYLPTINDILKGNMELLPPPKKKKYED